MKALFQILQGQDPAPYLLQKIVSQKSVTQALQRNGSSLKKVIYSLVLFT